MKTEEISGVDEERPQFKQMPSQVKIKMKKRIIVRSSKDLT